MEREEGLYRALCDFSRVFRQMDPKALERIYKLEAYLYKFLQNSGQFMMTIKLTRNIESGLAEKFLLYAASSPVLTSQIESLYKSIPTDRRLAVLHNDWRPKPTKKNIDYDATKKLAEEVEKRSSGDVRRVVRLLHYDNDAKSFDFQNKFGEKSEMGDMVRAACQNFVQRDTLSRLTIESVTSLSELMSIFPAVHDRVNEFQKTKLHSLNPNFKFPLRRAKRRSGRQYERMNPELLASHRDVSKNSILWAILSEVESSHGSSRERANQFFERISEFLVILF